MGLLLAKIVVERSVSAPGVQAKLSMSMIKEVYKEVVEEQYARIFNSP